MDESGNSQWHFPWQTILKRLVIAMFMGEYNHTIDAKSRLIIPSKFREILGEEFVVTKGLDGCLFVFDSTEWTAFEEKLRKLPSLTNPDVRKFVRFFMAGATAVDLDKQGRILIPNSLKDFAGLDKDVVLIGVGSRMEIWSKERYEGTVTYDDMEEVALHLSDLGLGI